MADVQWSPFANRDYWLASTSNQKALIWNLNLPNTQAPIEHVLHGHSRAITDINFSAHDPDLLATCSIDSFVQCWDLRQAKRPATTFADWRSAASQVKWNRQDRHVLASAHDEHLHIWDDRKGSEPLRSITAHSTKIYGIDWNRTEASQILTCSLDKSIKFWDYAEEQHSNVDQPMKVIHTSYPIWRARHTPFGHGVLAMPQRGGNNALHLYDRRVAEEGPFESHTDPLHVFDGHTDQVKEFLWRTQGTVDDGVDHRDFQLVSWGTDNNLLLHRLDEHLLERVGYRKGQAADDRIRFTRKNATYRTFHQPPAPKVVENRGLSGLFKGTARLGMRLPFSGTTASGETGANHKERRKNADPITWMKGVKVGASAIGERSLTRLRLSQAPSWSTRESLGEEIANVGDRLKKVSFDEVDILGRHATISLAGPWGMEGDLVHMKARVVFPDDYPELSAPELTIQKTPSISDAGLTRLGVEVKTLCDAYVNIGRGSLEALVRYLLGEWGVKDALAWADGLQIAMTSSLERLDGESSDDGNSRLQGLPSPFTLSKNVASDGMGRTGDATGNANVPLPKACAALWAQDGRLVCFFQQRDDDKLQSSITSTSQLQSSHDQAHSNHGFEAFGALAGPHLPLNDVDDQPDSSNTSSGSDDASSLSSTDSSGMLSDASESEQAHQPLTLRSKTNASRSLDHSSVLDAPSPSVPTALTTPLEQIISLQNNDDLLPAKRVLAQDYLVFGSGEQVCSHNADAARKHGYHDLGDVWEFLGLLLRNDVPLKSITHPMNDDEDILIVARRTLVHINRKDSGLDLAFDDPDFIKHPEYQGRAQLVGHPFGTSGLVGRLFDYFDTIADIQMLAMLSCVLAHQAHNDGISMSSVTKDHTKSSGLDLRPGDTYEYYISEEAVQSAFCPTPSQAEPESPDTETGDVEHQTSFGSNHTPIERRASHSTGPSSTVMSRQASQLATGGSNYASVQEETIKRSHSMLSSRLAASLSRPFSFMTSASASPPSQARTPELSTSAPSAGTAVVRQRSIDDGAGLQRAESRSSLAFEIDVESLPDTESDSDDEDDWEPFITLKNQDAYEDGEDFAILPSDREHLYPAWRDSYAHLLLAWQLPIKRAEILKFNEGSTLLTEGA